MYFYTYAGSTPQRAHRTPGFETDHVKCDHVPMSPREVITYIGSYDTCVKYYSTFLGCFPVKGIKSFLNEPLSAQETTWLGLGMWVKITINHIL